MTFLNEKFFLPIDYSVPDLNTLLLGLDAGFVIKLKIIYDMYLEDEIGNKYITTLKLDSPFERDIAEILERIAPFIKKIFGSETFRKLISKTKSKCNDIGQRTLDISMQFKNSLLGWLFECLGYKEKDAWGGIYGSEKQESLLIFLKHGLTPVYISLNDKVDNYYRDQQENGDSIGWKAPLLSQGQLSVFVDVLKKGFEAGLSEIQTLYYAGSSKEITIDGISMEFWQYLGFKDQNQGKEFMKWFGLAPENHLEDPSTIFDDHGLPKAGVFFDANRKPLQDSAGHPIFLVTDKVDMVQWWWNYLHLNQELLPSGAENIGHFWINAPKVEPD
ncbi:MAG: hypothetical protein K9W44_06830 [Candidatus Lokiarchaeota archaeon]|nr:hypothetical protein [Candidatus Harpocratesius repetitus]